PARSTICRSTRPCASTSPARPPARCTTPAAWTWSTGPSRSSDPVGRRSRQPPILQLVLVEAHQVADLVLHGDAHLARELVAIAARTQQVLPEQEDRARRAGDGARELGEDVAAHEQAEQVGRERWIDLAEHLVAR